jgi:pimeloyl-ACP methyl ester carboxylesterase
MNAPRNLSPADDPQPEWPIPAVYLLHGKGGSPAGTVALLQQTFERHWPGLEYVRLGLPHAVPTVPAEASVEFLLDSVIPKGALVVGVSLGGLVAAKLQELGRSDLQVIAISSPTWADRVTLECRADQRLAFFSSGDTVISARVADWPKLGSFARDFPWLDHNTDRHLKYLARIFDAFLEGSLGRWIDRIDVVETWRQETDEKVWDLMATAKKVRTKWRDSPWDGGRPQTFAEMGDVIRAGADWEFA